MKAIHFVSGEAMEELLKQAGFHRIQQFFKVFVLGGWVAFKAKAQVAYGIVS